jgi:hypothetical protein
MADRAVEEYASNSSSSDAADTSSFVYGPQGSQGILGITALTAARLKRVRFTTPIQPTDLVYLEIDPLASGKWVVWSGALVSGAQSIYARDYDNNWGASLTSVSGSVTDIDVDFGRYRASGPSTWATLAANPKWRVRKVSGGAQVGYPISVDNLINLTPSQLQWSGQNGYGSTNTVIRRFTTMTAAIGSNITATDSATLGATFTVNKNGMYSITYCDALTAGGNIGLSRNSAQLTTNIASITAANRLAIASTTANDVFACVSGVFYLTAGDVIRCHTDGTGATTSVARTNFYMAQVTT